VVEGEEYGEVKDNPPTFYNLKHRGKKHRGGKSLRVEHLWFEVVRGGTELENGELPRAAIGGGSTEQV